MDYNQAIDYIHAIPKFVRPLGNEKLGGLLALLENPHKHTKFVHVAGTNGKGSVSVMTAEILKRSGYRVGLFTSPFIEVFNERIRINGELIPDTDLAEYVTKVADIMEKNDLYVSEFAFITAVAFLYFYDKKCDIVVLETGMGGRLDATNIIPSPVCSVLTSISLDHTQYLGETIEAITREKCGIIKKNSYVVSAPNETVADIIKNEAELNNVPCVICVASQKTENGFVYKGREYPLALKGVYQSENAAVVCEVIDVLRSVGYDIPDTAVDDGFKNAMWQARYEFVTPDIVIDGGHNIDGIRRLKESLIAEKRDITLLIAMMCDKDYEACITEITSIAKSVVATELDIPRALKVGEIQRICQEMNVDCIAVKDVAEAVKCAVTRSGGGLLCICGSLYLAGEVKKYL